MSMKILEDTYTILFWRKLDNGYWIKESENISLNGKGKHKKAGKMFLKQHRGCKIISITYN